MNTVKHRQNEVAALRLQAAARWHLNQADNIDLIYWAVLITIPLLKFFWIKNAGIDFVLIIWFFLTFFLDFQIEKYTALGAEYKDNFDRYVYGWIDTIPKEVCSSSKKLEADYPEWFALQMRNNGNDNPRGVKDWYELITNEDDEQEAIQKAFTENVKYDQYINHTLYVVILGLISVFLSVAYFMELPFSDLLNTFFITYASLSKKVISTLKNISKSNKINKDVEEILSNSGEATEFQYAQTLLYKKRLISGISLRYIYSASKDKITKRLYRRFIKNENQD